MQVPVQVVLKNIPNAEAVRKEALKAAGALEHFHGRITSCRIAVTNPEARHRTGGLYDVHISLQLPGGKEVNVTRRAGDRPEAEHLSVALRKALAQARRQIQDAARKLRGDVKPRAQPRRTAAPATAASPKKTRA